MAKKAARRGRSSKQRFDDTQVIDLETVKNNIKAQKEGPKKKSWSVLDLKAIKPITEAQRAMTESYFTGNHIVATGSAGCGKTYLAVWLALNTILSKEFKQKKIMIVRSIVPTRDIGFLKGTEEEKVAVYEAPYVEIFADLLGKASSYEDMKEAGLIEFVPTSFVRGRTWDDAVIIVEEFQNQNFEELYSVLTRTGKNSRVIMAGDVVQNDLITKRNERSGYDDFMKVAKLMKSFDIIVFQKQDVVRSGFVRELIFACEDAGVI